MLYNISHCAVPLSFRRIIESSSYRRFGFTIVKK
jgi:hypothetical protein